MTLARRTFLACAAAGSLRGAGLIPVSETVDHLLLGAADLDQGIAWFERVTSVRAVPGGVHPGRGTRNALAGLGGRRYLEIIAPDPAQPNAGDERGLRQLAEPRFINFAVHTEDLARSVSMARAAGLSLSDPRDGSRRTPDGRMLQWRSASPTEAVMQSGAVAPVPFWIQWDPGSPHPSASAPAGCRLTEMRFESREPRVLTSLFSKLGIEAKCSPGPVSRIQATLQTPRGAIEIG